MSSPWEYFTFDELRCKCGTCGSDGSEMKPELMEPLDILREKLGFPLIVTSGYRCKWRNQNQGGKSGSAHLTGEAIDINIFYEKAFHFLEESYKLKTFRGIGIYQKGSLSDRFIHLDIKERNGLAIWSY